MFLRVRGNIFLKSLLLEIDGSDAPIFKVLKTWSWVPS